MINTQNMHYYSFNSIQQYTRTIIIPLNCLLRKHWVASLFNAIWNFIPMALWTVSQTKKKAIKDVTLGSCSGRFLCGF